MCRLIDKHGLDAIRHKFTKHSPAYKLAAINRVLEDGEPIKSVAVDIGLTNDDILQEDIKEAIEVYEQRYRASKELDDTDRGIHGISLEYDTGVGARLERARRYQSEAEATDRFLDRTKRDIDGTKTDIDAANSFLSDLFGRIREFIRRKWDALMERIKNRQYDYYEVGEAIEHHEEVIEELKEGELYQGPIMM